MEIINLFKTEGERYRKAVKKFNKKRIKYRLQSAIG